MKSIGETSEEVMRDKLKSINEVCDKFDGVDNNFVYLMVGIIRRIINE